MNALLLFFALPVSIILLSIVLQKILKNPILVAITFFAIFLIVAYAAFDSSFLIYVILYTILAYVTATLVRLICNIKEKIKICNQNSCERQSLFNNCCSNNCIESSSFNNRPNCNTDENNNERDNQASFTITTNQSEPVFFLTNRNNIRRNSCRCPKR